MMFLDKIKKFFYLKVLKRKYFRYGSCARCGACCTNIYVRHENKVIKTKEEFLDIKNNDDYYFYQIIEIKGQDDFGLIFYCTKFDKEKKSCKIHYKRPLICRKYPSEHIFSFGAQLNDNCGFNFKPIESFEEVMEKVKSLHYFKK